MVERVHRLLAGAALHVPARSPLCDRDAEVQSHPAVDARGRGGNWRAVRRHLSRGLAWRLPALRAHHPDLRPPAAEPRVQGEPDPPEARRSHPVGARDGRRVGGDSCACLRRHLSVQGRGVRSAQCQGLPPLPRLCERRGGGVPAAPGRGRQAHTDSIREGEGDVRGSRRRHPDDRTGLPGPGRLPRPRHVPGGSMDHFAFRVANLLVGNSQGAAALEVTVGGLKARFDDRRVLAVTGADMHATLNGRPLPLWESVGVESGDQLEMKTVKATGFRAYVAVSGAFDVPDYMGSRATFTVGGFGGFEGRGLKKGDRVPLGRGDGIDRLIGRRLRPSLRPPYASHWEIEAMRGPQADPDYLTPTDMDFFFSHAWKVDRNSNRMGVRLESHKWQWARTSGGIAGGHPSNILDDGYAVWTVNVCGDQPIILVADGPSLGGFICNATLVYASTWKVGQLVPGRDTITFKEVTIEEATQRARDLDATISERSIDRG